MAIAGLSIRLYLDENIHPWLARDLVRRGFDAVHALDLGHEGFLDDQHLAFATAEGRVILTYDRGDYQEIADQWRKVGKAHAGVIISLSPPRLPVSIVHRRILAFLDNVTADKIRDDIRWLDDRWTRTG